MATTTSPKTAPKTTKAPRRKPAAASKAAPKQPEERYVLVPLVDRARDAVVRLERGVHKTRRDLDRRGRAARRNLGANVEGISSRVEDVVQNGVNAGMKLVSGAQGRIKKAA